MTAGTVFTFRGRRAPRSFLARFLPIAVLGNVVPTVIGTAANHVAPGDVLGLGAVAAGVVSFLTAFVYLVFGQYALLALAVQRLHDSGTPTRRAVLALIPGVNLAYAVKLGSEPQIAHATVHGDVPSAGYMPEPAEPRGPDIAGDPAPLPGVLTAWTRFKARRSRRSFLLGVGGVILLALTSSVGCFLVISLIGMVAGDAARMAVFYGIAYVAGAALTCFAYAITVQRMRDLDYPEQWLLINTLPGLNVVSLPVFFLLLACTPGRDTATRDGPPPSRERPVTGPEDLDGDSPLLDTFAGEGIPASAVTVAGAAPASTGMALSAEEMTAVGTEAATSSRDPRHF